MSDQQQTPVTTRKDLESRIIAKALNDSKYKEQLLADPKRIVQQEVHSVDASVKLPDNLQIVVHEESRTTVHIVLPQNPGATAAGDDDLKDVPAHKIAVVRALRMG